MFLGNLPLVMRLGDQRRSDHSELILEIAQRLCSEAARSCLLNELRRDDLGVRLRIVRLFRRCRLSMPEAMTQLFLASRHTGLVLEALDWIQGHQQGVRYEAQLRALLKRRSPIVRREALRVLMATLPAAEVRLELERALIDMSPALRAFARFYLRQQGVADFAARYWQWLTHARQVNDAQVHAAALLGLADVGRAEDAAAFLPDFQAGEARIRAAAVEAVGRLAFDEHAERLIEMLHDSQPQVVAAACRVARKSIGSAHITALAKAIDAEHRPYQLRMLLNLVDRLLLFHRLSLCLLAASKTDSAMVSTAEIALARCFWQMRFRLSTLLCSSSATEALADVWSRLDALAPVNPPLAQHIQQTLATLGVYRCK
jgi:HEAT repeat protein